LAISLTEVTVMLLNRLSNMCFRFSTPVTRLAPAFEELAAEFADPRVIDEWTTNRWMCNSRKKRRRISVRITDMTIKLLEVMRVFAEFSRDAGLADFTSRNSSGSTALACLLVASIPSCPRPFFVSTEIARAGAILPGREVLSCAMLKLQKSACR
jgi:hypothetical protein